MANITSANATFTLTIPGIFAVPQTVLGFSTDAMWDSEAVTNGEFFMGVDGTLSAGWVPNPVPFTVHLQADSPSVTVFEGWQATEDVTMDKLAGLGIISVPSIKRLFICVNGYLQSGKKLPDAHRILQPRDFTILWQSVKSVPQV